MDNKSDIILVGQQGAAQRRETFRRSVEYDDKKIISFTNRLCASLRGTYDNVIAIILFAT